MRRLLVAVLAVGLVASCSSGDDDDDDAGAGAPATEPGAEVEAAAEAGVLTDRECDTAALPVVSECFWLEVPENRAEPDSATVRLPVTVLQSPAADAAPDPVVYLHGGPGDDALSSAENWADDPILETRDVVLFDQRGGGLAEPSLTCPEVDAAIIARFETASSYEDDRTAREAAWQTCRDRLVGEGIDLDAYDSEAIADDLESLRLAMDVDQWNLFGVSYGTRIALTYMREYPDNVRTALLDSVVSPDSGGAAYFIESGDRAIAQLVDGCLADSACAAAFPDFATAVDRAYERMNTEPFRGEVDLGEAGGVIEIVIDGSDAIGGLFTALYEKDLIPLLPTVAEGIASGDYAAIPAIAQDGIPFAIAASDGAAISIACADTLRVLDEEDDEMIASPGRNTTLAVENADSFCDLWDVEPVSNAFHDPVTVDVPTMVVAGRYDPATPPAGSEAVAAALPNAVFAEWDGIGHGVLFSDAPCSEPAWLTWLADPSVPPDLACAADAPPPAFVAG